MSKLDNPAYLADRLMMGPNGTVCHLDGLSAATNTEQSPRLVGNGGQGSACFRYSAEAPRRDEGKPVAPSGSRLRPRTAMAGMAASVSRTDHNPTGTDRSRCPGFGLAPGRERSS